MSCYCATFRLHFSHARRGRALAAILGKVPSVSGVCVSHFIIIIIGVISIIIIIVIIVVGGGVIRIIIISVNIYSFIYFSEF